MTISIATSKIIDQLILVVNMVSEADYSKPLGIYNGATLGKHFRHIHDFYECLISAAELGVVDYSKRERIEELECDPKCIVASFEHIRTSIGNLDTEKSIVVYGDFEYENGERPISSSSIGRELLYAYDHAVHHLAIIKLGIRAEFSDLEIDDDIGIAASTLRHQLANS